MKLSTLSRQYNFDIRYSNYMILLDISVRNSVRLCHMAIPKIKSATRFRNDLYETLKEVAEGEPCLITQKEGKNVILLSQDDYNRILNDQEVLRAISVGVSDFDQGKVFSHRTALSRLKKLRKKWK